MRVIRTALAAVVVGLLVAGDAVPAPGTTCPSGTGVGQLAYVKGGALRVLDMPACRERVLVRRGAQAPVRWSADARYVAFGSGVVSAESGRVFRGLRGVWSPRGHELAAITTGGGVVLRGPGLPERRLLPEGFGAHSLAFDPRAGRIAVARARPRGTVPPADRELWLVDTRARTRLLLYRAPRGDPRAPVVTRWAPGGFVLFSLALLPASSANLDGLPLFAVPAAGGRARRIVDAALSYGEFVAVCGGRLTISAGVDRMTTRGKRLVIASPPRWGARDLSRDPARSWTAPACSRRGEWVATSAGRNWQQTRFGLERRAIWLVSLDGRTRRRLTSPPPGRSDELPRWAAGGRAIFFVRSGPTDRNATVARGLVYVVRWSGKLEGPLTDLGPSGNYYGRYGWAEQTDLVVGRG